MSTLADRLNLEVKKPTPEAKPVKVKKSKYVLNVYFDSEFEEKVRNAAAQFNLGISTFVKMCVAEKIKEMELQEKKAAQ